MMKQIPLSRGKFALVDDKNFDFLMQWEWTCSNGYAARNERFEHEPGKYKTKLVLMHRVIMNTPKGMMTDHADGDRLNNQENNLRICTHAENMRNTVNIRVNNKSGFKGVSYDASRKKWAANIKINGKTKHLGRFDDVQEAARVYNLEALSLHEGFTRVNVF